MIDYLTTWFKIDKNVGKAFKYAYDELIEKFGKEKVGVSMHGCYKAFKRYSNFTFKRI